MEGLLENSKPEVEQTPECLTTFTQKMEELRQIYDKFEQNQDLTQMKNLTDLIITIHELSKEIVSKNIRMPNFFPEYYIPLLHAIFQNEKLEDDPRFRAFKIIVLLVPVHKASLQQLAEIINPLEFFLQFFTPENPLFPPTCLALASLFNSDFASNIKESPLFEQIISNLEIQISNFSQILSENQKPNPIMISTCSLMFQMLSGVSRSENPFYPPDTIQGAMDQIIHLCETFFGFSIPELYPPILRTIYQLSILIKSPNEEETSNIIDKYNMLEFFFNILNDDSLINCYSFVISIFIESFPFSGDIPLDKLSTLLDKNNGLCQKILIFFKEIIRKNEEVSPFFYDEDFLQMLIDLSNQSSASTVEFIAEFLLVLLTFSPIEEADRLLSNEDFGQIILSVLEGESTNTSNILALYYAFMQKFTPQGIIPETPLAEFIEAAKDPIDELCDSDDNTIRIYAESVFKYCYPEEYKERR